MNDIITDIVFLSRLQFALTAGFHFLFVPVTVGVIVLCAVMQSFYYNTGDEDWYKLVKFFRKLFIINFTVGVVSGISLEFQFGMNWARYSEYVGDIFGVPLAIEATVAFFLESIFLGVWLFGEKKISKKAHLISVWLVAFGSNISALWILFANAFMQKPVGYVIRNSRIELNDFLAFILNDYAWVKFFHTIFASYIVGAFFVIAVSSYHIFVKKNLLFKRSFKLASYFALLSSLVVIFVGHIHSVHVFRYQPTKFAAMEAVWESGTKMPYSIFVIPDEKNEKNRVEFIKIPYMLSFLSGFNINTEVKGLKDFPKDERPPVFITFFSFKMMVVFGILFILYSLAISYLSYKDTISNYPIIRKTAMPIVIISYLACQFGWIVAEVGRQPWTVYGILRTNESISFNLTNHHLYFSIIGYFLVYSILGFFAFYYTIKYAKQDLN